MQGHLVAGMRYRASPQGPFGGKPPSPVIEAGGFSRPVCRRPQRRLSVLPSPDPPDRILADNSGEGDRLAEESKKFFLGFADAVADETDERGGGATGLFEGDDVVVATDWRDDGERPAPNFDP